MAVRSIRNYRDFQRELAAGKVATGYIFYGPESYLIGEAVVALRDALLTDDFQTVANLPEEDDRLIVDQAMMDVLGARTPGDLPPRHQDTKNPESGEFTTKDTKDTKSQGPGDSPPRHRDTKEPESGGLTAKDAKSAKNPDSEGFTTKDTKDTKSPGPGDSPPRHQDTKNQEPGTKNQVRDYLLAEGEAQEAKLNEARRAVESFDYAGYQGRETDIDQVLMQIRTPPMIATRRLVVVKDFDKFRKEAQVQLLDELAKASPACRIVLSSGSESITLERLINSHNCARFLVAVPALGLDEAAQFIDRWAKQHHLKVADDAKLLLVETCGDSLGQLKGELDKIRTFLGPALGADKTSAVTKDMVRDLAGHWREYEISEFVDAVARRNRQQALSNLWRLNDWDEEPVKIVGWLAGRYLRMLAYGYGDAQLWTKQEITFALRHLSRIDLRLKTGYPEKYLLLENFVIRRTAARKPAPVGAARR